MITKIIVYNDEGDITYKQYCINTCINPKCKSSFTKLLKIGYKQHFELPRLYEVNFYCPKCGWLNSFMSKPCIIK